MEAELFELQKQQNDADMIDFRTGGAHAQECFRSWELLSNSTDEKQKNRVELIYTIRSKLKDYSKYHSISLSVIASSGGILKQS